VRTRPIHTKTPILHVPWQQNRSSCQRLPYLRVKTVDKIPGNIGSVFPYFLVIFILFGKYGNQYENGIWCHGNRSEYGWPSIPSVFGLGGKIQ
jgi:hypothetical protein